MPNSATLVFSAVYIILSTHPYAASGESPIGASRNFWSSPRRGRAFRRGRIGEEIKECPSDPHRNRYSALAEGPRRLSDSEYLDEHSGGDSSARVKFGRVISDMRLPTEIHRNLPIATRKRRLRRSKRRLAARRGGLFAAKQEGGTDLQHLSQTRDSRSQITRWSQGSPAIQPARPKESPPSLSQQSGQETAGAATSNFFGDMQWVFYLPLGGELGDTTDDETPRPKIREDGIDTWSAWGTNISRDLAPYVLGGDEPDEARAEQTSLVGQAEPQVSRAEEDMEGTPLSMTHLACA